VTAAAELTEAKMGRDRPAPLRDPAHLSIAFLGCGQAARMHARTLHKLDRDARLFFASRELQRATSYARLYHGAGAFGGYDAALADERVEVAVVVTPPSSHLEWTLAALEAGKHVIVEKPAFLRSSDFAQVESAARAARRQVLVAENYYYKPIAEALRRVFREQLLGRVLFLHVNALKRQNAEGWRLDPEVAGGGALFEGGIHWISLLAHLGPEVRSVHAAVAGAASLKEKSILVTLQYDGGAVASLSYSWEVPSLPGGLRVSRIYGSEGSATFESNGVFLATTGKRWRLRIPGLKDLLGYRAMFRDFVESLGEAREPRFRLADARRDVELVEEAYRSAGIRTS
jgi:UDP-N-acetylglucosamine 3-dehydrogenase